MWTSTVLSNFVIDVSFTSVIASEGVYSFSSSTFCAAARYFLP
jgi:hypothetical protein